MMGMLRSPILVRKKTNLKKSDLGKLLQLWAMVYTECQVIEKSNFDNL